MNPQESAGVATLRAYAQTIIARDVPGMFQGQAQAYLTDEALLPAVQAVLKAAASLPSS